PWHVVRPGRLFRIRSTRSSVNGSSPTAEHVMSSHGAGLAAPPSSGSRRPAAVVRATGHRSRFHPAAA
ncbi:hypothetical protein K7G98_24310, partial [Saccharothrix sp. MB29]|nr:hypothetical protein [Saccharothrix sp. MB29]